MGGGQNLGPLCRKTKMTSILHPNSNANTKLITTYLMEYAEDWYSSRTYLSEQAVHALLSLSA